MTITFRVSRKDLTQHYFGAHSCPIVTAYRRHINPMAKRFDIRADITTLYDGADRYSIRSSDNCKAFWRSRTWWGKLVGGFDVVLTKID